MSYIDALKEAYLFEIVALLIAILFLSIGLVVRSRQKRLRNNCTMCTYGTITNVFEGRVSDDGGRLWFPEFEFTVGDETLTKTTNTGSNPPRYKVGQVVQVFYNPNNYDEYYLDEDPVREILSTVFIAFGIMWMVVGLLTPLFVMYLC